MLDSLIKGWVANGKPSKSSGEEFYWSEIGSIAISFKGLLCLQKNNKTADFGY